jgi:hypothetical protein
MLKIDTLSASSPPLNESPNSPLRMNASNSILRRLVQATNRNNEVCEETNKIRQAEYKWKKDLNKNQARQDERPALLNQDDDPERVCN